MFCVHNLTRVLDSLIRIVIVPLIWHKNYVRSFLASTVKIELGTGQIINMFEVEVFSSGNNVASGKPSCQS